jgi:hypothetical protein
LLETMYALFKLFSGMHQRPPRTKVPLLERSTHVLTQMMSAQRVLRILKHRSPQTDNSSLEQAATMIFLRLAYLLSVFTTLLAVRFPSCEALSAASLTMQRFRSLLLGVVRLLHAMELLPSIQRSHAKRALGTMNCQSLAVNT